MRYLDVDGSLSGTGIRDAVDGGFVDPEELGLSPVLRNDIKTWLARYENAHYSQFKDPSEVDELDSEGISLCRRMRSELVGSKIGYFSDAKVKTMLIEAVG